MSTEHSDIVKLAKNLIGPGDLNPGGELRPEAASRLISMVFEDEFLSEVNTRRMSRTQADVPVFDVASRQLVRVPEGQKPSESQIAGASEHGTTLHALPVQLFPTISLGWLRDNADNPQLTEQLEGAFATKFRTELVDLGFNGEADDNSDGFLTLNKGWIQIAEDSSATHKVEIDPETDGWRDTLKAVLNQLPSDYRAEAVFVMNTADADAYAFELGGHVTGHALVADSPLRRFQGIRILANPRMPAGKVMLTPPSNIVYGMSTVIHQDKEYVPRARALEYTFDMAVDYELAVKDAVALGHPPAA